MRYFRYKVILILVIFKMKKIWLLTTLLVSGLLLTGCNIEPTNTELPNDKPINNTENNLTLRENLLKQYEWVNLSSLDEDDIILHDMIKYPLCKHPEVYSWYPRKVSEVVENCTQKKKTWDFVDWYGWIFPYWYTYDSNTNQILLLDYISEYYNPNYYWNWLDNKIEKNCTYISDWNFMYGRVITWMDYLTFLDNVNKNPWGRDAVYNAFRKWFIIQFPYDIEPSLCSEWDPDCEIMYSVWAWSDKEWNYFVVWKIPSCRYGVYLVNDYVLDPWYSDDIQYYDTNDKITWRSQRYFWWIKDDKIIVKRFLNYRSTWKQVEYKYKEGSYYRMGSEFTLETCEIPFSKIKNNKMRELVN